MNPHLDDRTRPDHPADAVADVPGVDARGTGVPGVDARGTGVPGVDDDVPTDAELLSRWRERRDQAAMSELVARHQHWLLATVCHLSRDEPDPEALVQEVWVRVVRATDRYREQAALRTWLYAIARNTVNSAWRARGSRPRAARWSGDDLAHFVDLPVGGDVEHQTELRDQLRGVLGHLPSAYRDVVFLLHVVGLSTAETAARLNLPANTVKSRASRGRAALRARLERSRTEEPR